MVYPLREGSGSESMKELRDAESEAKALESSGVFGSAK